jgi:hypothetical protein
MRPNQAVERTAGRPAVAHFDRLGGEPQMTWIYVPLLDELLRYLPKRNRVLRQMYLVGRMCSFRFASGRRRKLKITQPLVITVSGKASFDIGHAPADQIKPEN